MCARLCLNSENNGQDKNMSIFLILMKGDYDACLTWPFYYRIIFVVHDQSDKKCHLIGSFITDPQSNACQRPQLDMNIIGGIEKFFNLAIFKQKNSPYVKENAIFIQVIIDFNRAPAALVPYIASLDPALPTFQRHQLIQNKLDEYNRHH